MKIKTSVVFILCLLVIACQPKMSTEILEQELLNLHKETIRAHIDKNADFFIKNISEDYMQVQNGEFFYPEKDEIHRMFKNYLTNTEFLVYEDLTKPIVRIAKDGSVGWTIVQVRIKGEQKLKNDSIYSFDNTYAWITLYERVDNKWLRLGEVDNYKINE